MAAPGISSDRAVGAQILGGDNFPLSRECFRGRGHGREKGDRKKKGFHGRRILLIRWSLIRLWDTLPSVFIQPFHT